MPEQKSKTNGAVATVGVMMVIMLIGKTTGLFRDMLFASSFGTASSEANAFSNASMIPTFLDIAFASAFSANFIPVFNGLLETRTRKEAFTFANNFITIVIIFASVITVIAFFLAGQIASVFNVDSETMQLTGRLLRVMLPMLILSAAAFTLAGVLQSLGEFNAPAAMSVLSNLIIIAYFFLFSGKYGIMGLAVAFLVGWVAQLLIQIPSALKKGYVYKPYFNLRDKALKEVWTLTLPVLVATWTMPLNLLVNFAVIGNSAALRTANTLYSVITGVFVLSISNYIFPEFSKIAAKGNESEFASSVKRTASILIFILLPMSGGLIVLAEPLVRLFFERGLFDASSTEQTKTALALCSFGIAGFGLQTILSRAFFAQKSGREPLVCGTISMAVNLVLSLSFTSVLGVGGPALANAAAITSSSVLMYILLWKNHRQAFDKALLFDIIKMLAAAAVMTACVYFIHGWALERLGGGTLSTVITLAVCGACGVIIYFVLCMALRISTVPAMISLLSKKVKK